MRPFSFTQSALTQQYTKLTPISLNTFMKYMNLVTEKVEQRISNELPNKFALVIVGWTKNSNHFLAVFALWSSSSNVKCSALLGFSPLLDETKLDAVEHYDFITYVLEIYEKDLSSVVCLIMDNCETNKALSNICSKPMIGLASHRFNLAVCEYLTPHGAILAKVSTLMPRLKGLKLSAKLRTHTQLRPILQNATRWSSIYEMLTRYFALKPVLEEHFGGEIKLIDHFPTIRENNELQSLMETLKIFESVTKALQSEDIDLSMARTLFDNVIIKVPGLDVNRKYLTEDATIVKYPFFESGIVKIVDRKTDTLTEDEKAACQSLLSDNNVLEISSGSESDFARSVLKKKRARISLRKS